MSTIASVVGNAGGWKYTQWFNDVENDFEGIEERIGTAVGAWHQATQGGGGGGERDMFAYLGRVNILKLRILS